MTSTRKVATGQQALALVGWLALSFAAALGAGFTSPAWYAQLARPSWRPPPWVFGPVWSTLYVLMGVSAWLIWREGGWQRQRLALGLFLAQWGLNALWTPVFFGLRRIDLALLDIVLLWLLIVATIVAFWRTSRPAAMLLIPYILWVTVATALNFGIWQLNGTARDPSATTARALGSMRAQSE